MKRLISALLAIFTVAALICVPVVATEPAETFWADQVPANHTLQGSGTQADPYLITSAIDLAYLAVAISGDVYLAEKSFAEYQFQGKYFLQTADIDLSAHTWVPIGGVKVNRYNADGSENGTPAANFVGNYDGNYHSITGMKVTDNSFKYNLQTKTLGTSTNVVGTVQTSNGAGLFGRLGNNNKTASTRYYLKNLAVIGQMTFTSVVPSSSGMIGYLNGIYDVENIYSDINITIGTTTTATSSVGAVGGIVGLITIDNSAKGQPSFKNCVAEGNITVYTSTAGFQIGGLIGKWVKGTVAKKIENCYFTGAINVTTSADPTVNTRAAGIIGQFGDGSKTFHLLNSHMWGTVTVTSTAAAVDTAVDCVALVAGYNNQDVSGQLTGSTYLKPNGCTLNAVGQTDGSSNRADAELAAWADANEITAVTTAGTVPFKGTTKFLVDPDSVVLRFAQERKNGDTMDVRFLGTGVAGTVSGFKVTATLSVPSEEEGGEPTVTNGTPNVDIPVTVYETINADGKTGITAQQLGGKANDKIIGCVITGVPTTGVVTFVITPYVDAVEGATMTIVYTDGVYTSCTIAD